MRFSDAIIIYLSIGSPIGVYFFVRSGRKASIGLLSGALLALLLWPFYAIWFINHSENGKLSSYGNLDARYAKRVDEIRSAFEEIIRHHRPGQSIFDLREVFERYVGLTSALSSKGEYRSESIAGLFARSGGEAELNKICLDRRNQRILEFHQIRARNDFLLLVSALSDGLPPETGSIDLALELSSLLMDRDAIQDLIVAKGLEPQSGNRSAVIDLESDLWTPNTQSRSAAS